VTKPINFVVNDIFVPLLNDILARGKSNFGSAKQNKIKQLLLVNTGVELPSFTDDLGTYGTLVASFVQPVLDLQDGYIAIGTDASIVIHKKNNRLE